MSGFRLGCDQIVVEANILNSPRVRRRQWRIHIQDIIFGRGYKL